MSAPLKIERWQTAADKNVGAPEDEDTEERSN